MPDNYDIHPPSPRWTHIALRVSDIDKTIDWYVEHTPLELIEKRIDGFGELFRALSYQEVGTAAMLSRALAGTARGKVLISIPGSVNAVRLAVTKLILPEIGHLVREASR